jgi:membrane-bound lytic murein transglycosylase F
MQLLPATAAELNCPNPFDPESNIKGGTCYMARLRNKFSASPDMLDRWCFALASYNGGYGHLSDARILAVEMGLDQNVWKNNVEIAIKKLATAEYASRSRYGYCQAPVIINYVNQIILRYHQYKQTADNNAAAASPAKP